MIRIAALPSSSSGSTGMDLVHACWFNGDMSRTGWVSICGDEMKYRSKKRKKEERERGRESAKEVQSAESEERTHQARVTHSVIHYNA